MSTVPKVVRDGKVAVVVSPGFGAGWSTWVSSDMAERALFSPEVVAWVEGGKAGDIQLPDDLAGAYDGGLQDAVIQWIDAGTAFYVEDYDGHETLRMFGFDGWVA